MMNAMSEVSSSGRSDRRRLIKRVFVALFVLGVGAATSGCGPVQSTQRISQAEVAFERARVVEAHEKAPYEYKSAQYYLHKAKEEWGYSDFEAAYDYATEAKSAAEAARLKAKEDPWPGHPVLDREDVMVTEGETGPEGFTEDDDDDEVSPEGFTEEGDEQADDVEKEGDESSEGEDSP
jgi:hypothetical protein